MWSNETMHKLSLSLLLCLLVSVSVYPFVKNVGQVAPHVLYYRDMPGYRLYVTGSYLCLQKIRLHKQDTADTELPPVIGADVSYVYIDLPNQAVIEPMDRSTTYVNIFRGREPKGWHTRVPVYERIRIHNFNPGISLEVSRQGWRFMSRNHNVKAATFTPRGQLALRQEEGDIVLHTHAGDIRLQAPLFQDSALRQGSVTVSLNTIRVTATATAPALEQETPRGHQSHRTRQQRLYSTHLGSLGRDSAEKIAVDSQGNIVFTGQTDSLSMLACDGHITHESINEMSYDMWIGKMSPDLSTLLWQTYVSGSEDDYCDELAIDESDNNIVIGYTWSDDLPITQGYDLTFNGGVLDAYLFKLNPGGDDLLFTTYFGGGDAEIYSAGLNLAANNDILFSIGTYSTGIPAPNGYCQELQGGRDIYFGRLSADGMNLLAGTYLGTASYHDDGGRFVIDSAGDVIVTMSGYPGLPLVNNLSAHNGGWIEDGYLAKFSPYLDDIRWSTYYGGTSYDSFGNPALDENDNILFSGISFSKDIKLVNPICVCPDGETTSANFIGKISQDGQEILWATFVQSRYNREMEDSAISKLIYRDGDVYALVYNSSITYRHAPNSYATYIKDTPGRPTVYNNFYKISQAENELTWGSYFFRRNPFTTGEYLFVQLTISDMLLTADNQVVIFGSHQNYEMDNFSYIPTDANSYMPRPPSQGAYHESVYLAVLTNPTERAMIKQPELLTPCNHVVGLNRQVELTWRKTEPFLEETGYTVRVSWDWGNKQYTYYQVPAGVYSLTLSGLRDGRTYAWSVKALGEAVYPFESFWGNRCADFTFQTKFEKYPCYRFYNGQVGDYLYTTSAMERDYLLNNATGYAYEGIAFYGYKSNEWPDTEYVRRYYNVETHIHVCYMYPESPDPYECWRQEDVMFYAFPNQAPDTVPVYRFHHSERGGYLLTASTIERDYILNNLPNYEYQGIVFFVYPTE